MHYASIFPTVFHVQTLVSAHSMGTGTVCFHLCVPPACSDRHTRGPNEHLVNEQRVEGSRAVFFNWETVMKDEGREGGWA